MKFILLTAAALLVSTAALAKDCELVNDGSVRVWPCAPTPAGVGAHGQTLTLPSFTSSQSFASAAVETSSAAAVKRMNFILSPWCELSETSCFVSLLCSPVKVL